MVVRQPPTPKKGAKKEVPPAPVFENASQYIFSEQNIARDLEKYSDEYVCVRFVLTLQLLSAVCKCKCADLNPKFLPDIFELAERGLFSVRLKQD